MSQTLIEIQTKIAELENKAKQLIAAELAEAVADINAKIAQFNLTPGDLKFRDGRESRETRDGRSKSTKVGGKKAPVKYRDGNGHEWTGRGLQPKWLTQAIADGATRESFAV